MIDQRNGITFRSEFSDGLDDPGSGARGFSTTYLDEHTRLFEEHRPLLLGVVYRMLGTAADAEDVVHDTYLRWREVDLAGIHSPRSYLLTIATRLAIDLLRSARMQRESYTGQWLPEPLGEGYLPQAEGNLEMAESLQTAFMLLLERLSANQRAAYILYDIFDLNHAEVARILDTSPANSRQLVRRARVRLSEGRARFESSPERIEEVTQRFLEVCAGALGASRSSWSCCLTTSSTLAMAAGSCRPR